MLDVILGAVISLLIRVESTDQYSRADKIYYICQAAEVDQDILTGIMEVESHGNINLIGDTHMANKAYGLFQLRQPAVDHVNRVYGLKRKMSEIKQSETLQIAYAAMYLKIMEKETGDIDNAIYAYNMGLSNVKAGYRNDYLAKVNEAIKKQGGIK